VQTSDDEPTLLDLSNAILESDLKSYEIDYEVQSLGYRAPEVLTGALLSPAMDIWSLGCVAFQL
jgi:dual specificity tyrosine-phosphorylation-regulated kinase 2/3/4